MSGYGEGYDQQQGYYGQQQPQRPYGEEGYGQGSYGQPQQQYGQQPPYGSSEYPPREEYGQQRFEGQGYPPRQEYGQQRFEGQEYPPGNPPYGAPNPEGEGDRGIMGALAGGAAGGFAGHKMHHGFLGGVGGAIAGSMLEDQYKKHEHEKKEHEQQEQYARHHQGQGPHMGGGPPSGFLANSRDVHLEDNCVLVAECANHHGSHYRSAIDLNNCLTNNWGQFDWARDGNFAASARGIRLVDGGRVLEAELNDGNGGWRQSHVWLNERITNNNGCLEMM